MNASISRRGLLGGAAALGIGAAVAGAGALSGCSPSSSGSSSSDYVVGYGEINWDYETDLLVVGSGTVLGAAMTALDEGVNVMVIEKMANAGGDWSINGGVLYAGATQVQTDNNVVDERTGEADTIDSCYEDWQRRCDGGADATILRRIVEDAPSVIDYFTEKGITWNLYQSGEDPIARGHQNEQHSGGAFVQILCEDIESKGGQIVYNMKGKRPLFDVEGKVVGMECRDMTNGNAVYIKAKAVDLGTGGASYNEELIARYNPQCYNLGTVSGPWATGDGLIMGAEIGAAFYGYNEMRRPGGMCEYYTQAVPQLDADVAYTFGAPHSLIYVGMDGKREFMECSGDKNTYGDTYSSPQFGIFDQAEYENEAFTVTVSLTKDGVDTMIENGEIVKADSIEELADALYIDKENLVDTISRFNRFAESGNDEDWERPAETMRAFDNGPYYAYKVLPIDKDVSLSFDVTSNYEVRDADGIVFPGLYASGSKLVKGKTLGPGAGYPGSGCYCMSGYVSSQYAGRFAADYIKSLQ